MASKNPPESPSTQAFASPEDVGVTIFGPEIDPEVEESVRVLSSRAELDDVFERQLDGEDIVFSEDILNPKNNGDAHRAMLAQTEPPKEETATGPVVDIAQAVRDRDAKPPILLGAIRTSRESRANRRRGSAAPKANASKAQKDGQKLPSTEQIPVEPPKEPIARALQNDQGYDYKQAKLNLLQGGLITLDKAERPLKVTEGRRHKGKLISRENLEQLAAMQTYINRNASRRSDEKLTYRVDGIERPSLWERTTDRFDQLFQDALTKDARPSRRERNASTSKARWSRLGASVLDWFTEPDLVPANGHPPLSGQVYTEQSGSTAANKPTPTPVVPESRPQDFPPAEQRKLIRMPQKRTLSERMSAFFYDAEDGRNRRRIITVAALGAVAAAALVGVDVEILIRHSHHHVSPSHAPTIKATPTPHSEAGDFGNLVTRKLEATLLGVQKTLHKVVEHSGHAAQQAQHAQHGTQAANHHSQISPAAIRALEHQHLSTTSSDSIWNHADAMVDKANALGTNKHGLTDQEATRSILRTNHIPWNNKVRELPKGLPVRVSPHLLHRLGLIK